MTTVVMASPHWLWYGEKSGINAIILWLIFSFFYRVSLGLSYHNFDTKQKVNSIAELNRA